MVEIKSANTFIVYPNPVKEQLNVELPEDYRNGTLRLINAAGETLYSTRVNSANKHVIDVTVMAAGTYIVQIEAVNGQRLQKTVIIQKREPRP